MTRIHPTASIDPRVELHETAEIGPYCILEGNIRIGQGTVLRSHVVIEGKVTIGEENIIYPFVTIGFPPQDVKYLGSETEVIIGNKNLIREYVSIHRGTEHGGGQTVIGNENFFMAYTHIAHDCRIGNHVILTNGANLGGHVEVEDHATVGAFSGVHQFCRLGQYSFVAAYSGIPKDVVPYSMVAGNRAKLFGINAVGLKRAGFPQDEIDRLKSALMTIFHRSPTIQEGIEQVLQQWPDDKYIQHLCTFISHSKRGVIS